MASASDRQPGMMIGHETPVETGTRSRIGRCRPLPVHVAPRGSLRNCSSTAVRKLMRMSGPPRRLTSSCTVRERRSESTTNPTLTEVRHTGEDRPIAADLL